MLPFSRVLLLSRFPWLGFLSGKMGSAISTNANRGRVVVVVTWTVDLELTYSSKCRTRFTIMERGERWRYLYIFLP